MQPLHNTPGRGRSSLDPATGSTAVLCKCCEGISIPSLVRLARTEFEGYQSFPQEAFYEHHATFSDLETSAVEGCVLCDLVLECFKGAPVEDDIRGPSWPEEWISEVDRDLDASMYGVAKSLPDSTVRVAISADHVYANASIKDVTEFDTLLFQVGPPDEDPEADMYWLLHPLALTLTISRDCTLKIGGFRIGRFETIPDLSAAENFDVARSWLQTCRQEHVNCLSDEARPLPTRVIDVGTSLASHELRIFHPRGSRAHYVALSHCWGGRISPLLTTSTMEEFASCLPFAELPANFRDAVTITRQMGVRYLWIDSLCIIQDSKEDWAQESVKMAAVYQNSVFTISALSSSGSTRGILTSRPSAAPLSKNIALKVGSGDFEAVTVRVSRYQRQSEYLNELTIRCPLYSRGWCLQEAVLSPRHLYYGREQIYWRCPSGFQDAEGCGPGRRFPGDAYPSISSILFEGILLRPVSEIRHNKNAILSEYYLLVQAYSQRNLTFGSDKLPAFSGIAQRLQPALGGTYLAGLWSTDICRSLSWRAEYVTAKHAWAYRSPSWSWAVTDESIWFDVPSENFDKLIDSLSLQLLESHMVFRDLNNPWGEVKSGSLRVKGLTKPLARSSQVVDAWPCNFSIGTAYFDNEDVRDEIGEGRDQYTMSMWSLFRKEGEEGIISIITTLGKTQNWEIKQEAIRAENYMVLLVYAEEDEGEWAGRPSGLILERDDDNDADDHVYRRVGAIRLSTLKISWLEGWKEQTITLV